MRCPPRLVRDEYNGERWRTVDVAAHHLDLHRSSELMSCVTCYAVTGPASSARPERDRTNFETLEGQRSEFRFGALIYARHTTPVMQWHEPPPFISSETSTTIV
ncbi:MAG: hypothetical protein E6R14_02215 [Thermomicrobiales bacterium]|nr:MAG: hypothetical protein E6R14_02215 [Thermomicrobiales bacterium]